MELTDMAKSITDESEGCLSIAHKPCAETTWEWRVLLHQSPKQLQLLSVFMS